MSPVESDDLTDIVARCDDGYAVLRSPETAEHSPGYRKVATFATLKEVEDFLNAPDIPD